MTAQNVYRADRNYVEVEGLAQAYDIIFSTKTGRQDHVATCKATA
jgi:NADH:ubiquinone oxidoreductase subunit E